MLILPGTNDRIQVQVSSTSVDIHTTWVDTASGAITPGRLNLAVTTAGIVTSGPAPGPGTQRNVKSIHIRNKATAADAPIIVQHTDGVNTVDLYATTLRPGAALQYTDQGGFRVL